MTASAHPVNLIDSFNDRNSSPPSSRGQGTATTSDFQRTTSQPRRLPPTNFRVSPPNSSQGKRDTSPSPGPQGSDQGVGVTGTHMKLPPISAAQQKTQTKPAQPLPVPSAAEPYLTHHHTLRIRRKLPSAYLRNRVGADDQFETNKFQNLNARVASLAMAAVSEPDFHRADSWFGQNQQDAMWGNSNIGDLEALDSILDHLVVLDNRMRTALLRGPLISFETVVPEGRAAALVGVPGTGDEEHRDLTFLTSVKVPGGGVPEEGEEEEQEQQGEPATAAAAPELEPPRSAGEASSHVQWDASQLQHQPPPQPPQSPPLEERDIRAAIPVPVLPRLARMYINSKVAQQPKAPPPPAPTADYLLKTRPPPFIEAPSYDTLCQQIRDVQRQYTCGTVKERAVVDRTAAHNPNTSANMYISGLDGPTLEEVVTKMDLPLALERARPSFVAMKRALSTRRKSAHKASRDNVIRSESDAEQ